MASRDAADVVQEVLAAISRNLGAFHRDQPGDSFRAWLRTISKNKIRDHFRRRAQSPPVVGGTDMQLQMQQVPELTWESSSDGNSCYVCCVSWRACVGDNRPQSVAVSPQHKRSLLNYSGSACEKFVPENPHSGYFTPSGVQTIASATFSFWAIDHPVPTVSTLPSRRGTELVKLQLISARVRAIQPSRPSM